MSPLFPLSRDGWMLSGNNNYTLFELSVKKGKQKNASKKVHHPWCITTGTSPLVHHLLSPPCWSRAPCQSSPPCAPWRVSHSHTVTLSQPLLHPQDSVALIIEPNLEDGHRPNLLVPLSNLLILKDHRPNLSGFNEYSVESTPRR